MAPWMIDVKVSFLCLRLEVGIIFSAFFVAVGILFHPLGHIHDYAANWVV